MQIADCRVQNGESLRAHGSWAEGAVVVKCAIDRGSNKVELLVSLTRGAGGLRTGTNA